ncbi:MAG: 50S ribosomal protein L17 [Patescibacteria group bacterium]
MRHRIKKIPRLGRNLDHRKLLLRNLATSLILHDKIQTSAAKARAVQPVVERLITNVKKKAHDREAIRYLKSILLDERAQKKTLAELKHKYAERKSGFTRVTPIGIRKGDAAPKVQIELV